MVRSAHGPVGGWSGRWCQSRPADGPVGGWSGQWCPDGGVSRARRMVRSVVSVKSGRRSGRRMVRSIDGVQTVMSVKSDRRSGGWSGR